MTNAASGRPSGTPHEQSKWLPAQPPHGRLTAAQATEDDRHVEAVASGVIAPIASLPRLYLLTVKGNGSLQNEVGVALVVA
jgi:hypothetical protein